MSETLHQALASLGFSSKPSHNEAARPGRLIYFGDVLVFDLPVDASEGWWLVDDIRERLAIHENSRERNRKCWILGANAAMQHKSRNTNPYIVGSVERCIWAMGYDAEPIPELEDTTP